MAMPIVLIPHRPPWSLVDRVESIEGNDVVAHKQVTAGDRLLGDQGLGGLLLIEALAQTAACLMGAREGGASHLGYLVAAQGWKFHGSARPGETVRLAVRLTAELGSLHRFDGRASVGDRVLAAGSMTFAVPQIAASVSGALDGPKPSP